ncbi:hypothetical protein NX059_010586 [Plenodomus lindquistii]|nr:hypothetical protein NX059_010586 [Plenodomus lindquistii]
MFYERIDLLVATFRHSKDHFGDLLCRGKSTIVEYLLSPGALLSRSKTNRVDIDGRQYHITAGQPECRGEDFIVPNTVENSEDDNTENDADDKRAEVTAEWEQYSGPVLAQSSAQVSREKHQPKRQTTQNMKYPAKQLTKLPTQKRPHRDRVLRKSPAALSSKKKLSMTEPSHVQNHDKELRIPDHRVNALHSAANVSISDQSLPTRPNEITIFNQTYDKSDATADAHRSEGPSGRQILAAMQALTNLIPTSITSTGISLQMI